MYRCPPKAGIPVYRVRFKEGNAMNSEMNSRDRYPRSLIERYTKIHGDPFKVIEVSDKELADIDEKNKSMRKWRLMWLLGATLLLASFPFLFGWVRVDILNNPWKIPFLVFYSGAVVFGFAWVRSPNGMLISSSREKEWHAKWDQKRSKAFAFLDSLEVLIKIPWIEPMQMDTVSVGDLVGIADKMLKFLVMDIRDKIASNALDSSIARDQDRFRSVFSCFNTLQLVQGTPDRYVLKRN